MDNTFTEKVMGWLETTAAQRDYDKGALYLLQLSNNQIMYRNLSRNARKHGDFIEHQIRKYMKFRLQRLTHAEVEQMQDKVDKIAILRNLDAASESAESEDDGSSVKFRAGRRYDHDSLPSQVQALYVENASIMQKMRELHLRLRNLSLANATCPDSERYPFLKELIELDKQYHSNWKVYDSYRLEGASAGVAEVALVEDVRSEQKNIMRQINLTKGRFKKNPSEALKGKIAGLYSQLVSPPEELTQELKLLGVIE